MSVPHPHPAKSELFENGRRIKAQSVANLLEGLAGGVVLDRLVDLHVAHAPWSLGDASSIEMLAHRDSVDLELLGYLVDSHAF